MRQEGRIQHPKKVNWSRLDIPKYVPFGRKAEAAFYLKEAAKTQPSLLRLAETPNIGFDSLTFAPNEDPGELYAACAMAAMITPRLPNIFGTPCDEAETDRRIELLSKLVNGYLSASLPKHRQSVLLDSSFPFPPNPRRVPLGVLNAQRAPEVFSDVPQ